MKFDDLIGLAKEYDMLKETNSALKQDRRQNQSFLKRKIGEYFDTKDELGIIRSNVVDMALTIRRTNKHIASNEFKMQQIMEKIEGKKESNNG